VLTGSWGGFLYALLTLLTIFCSSAASTVQCKSWNIGLHGQLAGLATQNFVQVFLKDEVFMGRLS